MNKLNIEVLEAAKQKGICEEWAEKIATAKSKSALLQMFIDGIDFCLSREFPNKDFLKATGASLLNQFGIFIDTFCGVQNPEKLVLLGNCEAKVTITDFAVSQIFIKHFGKAEIEVSHNAFAVIDVFDDVELKVTASGTCKVLVNVYGRAKVNHQHSGDAFVKVVEKLKDSY